MLQGLRQRIRARRGGGQSKGAAELAFWERRKQGEGTVRNDQFERFFTSQFGLTPDDFAGKRLLDIGCGPRGSLEWASMAAERAGADPLADEYRRLGTDDHAMTYVAAGAEHLPFDDAHFDVVSAFNALDHVDDLQAAVGEYTRVARPDAVGLLLTEVGHEPTVTEPQTLDWDVLDLFAGWRVVTEDRIAMKPGPHDVYGSWLEGRPWTEGSGLLAARLERVA